MYQRMDRVTLTCCAGAVQPAGVHDGLHGGGAFSRCCGAPRTSRAGLYMLEGQGLTSELLTDESWLWLQAYERMMGFKALFDKDQRVWEEALGAYLSVLFQHIKLRTRPPASPCLGCCRKTQRSTVLLVLHCVKSASPLLDLRNPVSRRVSPLSTASSCSGFTVKLCGQIAGKHGVSILRARDAARSHIASEQAESPQAHRCRLESTRPRSPTSATCSIRAQDKRCFGTARPDQSARKCPRRWRALFSFLH